MRRLLIAVAFCLVPTTFAQAELVFINYNVATGPNWNGTVDTAANTLTITSWQEQSGGALGWTPAMPLPVWSAVNSSGNSYDVPDTFDGTISFSWGFISPVSVTAMSWNEGTVQSTFSNYYTGWGARRGAGRAKRRSTMPVVACALQQRKASWMRSIVIGLMSMSCILVIRRTVFPRLNRRALSRCLRCNWKRRYSTSTMVRTFRRSSKAAPRRVSIVPFSWDKRSR